MSRVDLGPHREWIGESYHIRSTRFPYTSLNLGSTDPIVLSIVTHLNSTARAEAGLQRAQRSKRGRRPLALACNFIRNNNYVLFSGQFFRKGVEIDEVRKILIMPDKEPVPVMRRPVWSFMEREVADDQLCWTAMNPGYQGDGLIDGRYLDYLVDDVLDTEWSFKKTK